MIRVPQLSSEDLQSPSDFAKAINRILGHAEPQAGTSENGWFPGYGCRWCNASRAWFTVLQFEQVVLVGRLVEMFKAAGCREVATGYEGGVGPDDGGRGIQISAYV